MISLKPYYEYFVIVNITFWMHNKWLKREKAIKFSYGNTNVYV